jgi:hypothetical protein
MHVHEVYLDGNFMPIIQDVQKFYCRTITFKWRVNKISSRVKEPSVRGKGDVQAYTNAGKIFCFFTDPD